MTSSPVTSDSVARVICVGQAVFDHRFMVNQIPARPTKVLAHDYLGLPGGMASGAAITAARLGAETHLITRMGSDPMADLLMQCFAAEGIQCAATCRVANRRTAVSAVVIDAHGERQIIHAPTDAFEHGAPLTADDLTTLLNRDSVPTVMVCDPRWSEGAETALRFARAHQRPSVLDADVAPAEVLLPLVALADWAIFSEAALDTLFPASTVRAQLQQALDAGARHAAVTQGEKGVQWLEETDPALHKEPHSSADELHHKASADLRADTNMSTTAAANATRAAGNLTLHHLPALPLTAKDTTGAGDAFHGAFAVALAHGKPTHDCFVFANRVAGLKVANGNGILGAPTLAELLDDL
jgi:sulfofructose kinase